MTQHLLYGHPPLTLVSVPAGAVQCSPLVIGSARMMDFPAHSVASATIYAPPSTRERRYVLARALSALAVGSPLAALAPKDKGGNRLVAELEAFGCIVTSESRQHHRIAHTTCPALLHGVAEAIAEGGFQQHPAHGLWTHAGVFSWDRLDAGTALLLKHLPTLRGTGADFGCGLGGIAQVVLQSPEVQQLTLIDIDRRAVGAATRNIPDSRAHFLWADIRAPLALENLDFVVMNPPFHEAGLEDKSLGQAFIARAASVLKSGGACWLTANRHLPYEALLDQHFSRTTRVAEADGFKIYHAEK